MSEQNICLLQPQTVTSGKMVRTSLWLSYIINNNKKLLITFKEPQNKCIKMIVRTISHIKYHNCCMHTKSHPRFPGLVLPFVQKLTSGLQATITLLCVCLVSSASATFKCILEVVFCEDVKHCLKFCFNHLNCVNFIFNWGKREK
jgi:hypothetical protein